MSWWPPPFWLRFRTWLGRRVALWRGRWQRAELEAPVARWTWWPLPWSQRQWRYAVYCPGVLRDDEAAPLVVLLHGCRQRALAFAHASGWVRAAERGRFRLLCPEQREAANPWRCWNWFHPAAQTGRGELDVVAQAVDDTRARLPVQGVAAVGLSAGGGLAALLAFHRADHFDAVVAVAAPPLLGRANMQDPRQVMRHGLAISPPLATHLIPRCAPLAVVQGADDAVVAPRCAEQLAEQARHVLEREFGGLAEQPTGDGVQYLADGRVVLRLHRLSGVGHVWSGAPGGHEYVVREGPPLTELALDFLRGAGVLAPRT